MHELITDYPGAPGEAGAARWWTLFDEEELTTRRRRGAPQPDRLLQWDVAPSHPEAVEELRIRARDVDVSSLPAWVASLPRLTFLELPIRFLRSLTPAAVPSSLRVLDAGGTGTVTVPRSLVLPGVTFLLSDTGTLKFTRGNFPSLDRLSLGLDRPQTMLDVVAEYDRLRALHLSSVHADDLFDRIGRLRLEYLGLVNGKLGSLKKIGALGSLRSLQLKNLPKLTELSGLGELEALEELSIGYASALRDVSAIADLPRLRRLMIFGCGRIGVDAIRPTLEAKGLQQLSLGGAT